MARTATGTVYWYKNHWAFKITLPNGDRGEPVHLPAEITEEQARALARKTSTRAREQAAIEQQRKPLRTADAWAERWFTEREASGQTGVRQDRSRWRTWISKHLISMTTATEDDVENIVRALDKAVRDGDIRPKTASLAWGVATSAFDEACQSKVPELRVRKRDDDPTERVRGPDPGAERVAAWLYPNEMGPLLACARVPPRWRRLIALQGYTYLRPGELEALAPDDVDLVGDVLVISRAADYSKPRGATKLTKTAIVGIPVRRVPIESAIRPLVEVLLHEARTEGRGRLVMMPPVSDLAANFRTYLRRAGLVRPELYTDDNARRPIRWRDLRGTGLTWRALRGDRLEAIQAAAGHTSIATTQGYIKAAEVVGKGVGEPFPPIPPELLQSSPIVTGTSKSYETAAMLASPAGFEPHLAAADGSDGNVDHLISSPIGVLRAAEATALAEAVTSPETIAPASLVAQARDAAAAGTSALARGDYEEAREHWRDWGTLLQFAKNGVRRRGVRRYITDPRTKVTLTVSDWARLLGRTSQGLTHRLDTMSLRRALVPAKDRAA